MARRKPEQDDADMMPSDESIVELDQNLAEFEDFEILPKGTYPAAIEKVTAKVSEAGNRFYAVQFLIKAADYPADYDIENSPEGTRVTWNRMLVPTGSNRRTITRMKAFYDAMGLDRNVKRIDPSEWIGRSVKLVVEHREFNGEDQLEIRSVEALD